MASVPSRPGTNPIPRRMTCCPSQLFDILKMASPPARHDSRRGGATTAPCGPACFQSRSNRLTVVPQTFLSAVSRVFQPASRPPGWCDLCPLRSGLIPVAQRPRILASYEVAGGWAVKIFSICVTERRRIIPAPFHPSRLSPHCFLNLKPSA